MNETKCTKKPSQIRTKNNFSPIMSLIHKLDPTEKDLPLVFPYLGFSLADEELEDILELSEGGL